MLIADFLQKIVLTTTKSIGIPSAKLVSSFVFYFIFIMAIITAVSQLGIGTEFIATNLSIIIGGGVMAFALGYGIASKSTMSNFLASFYSRERFKIGDRIKLEETEGEIVGMDSSSLTLSSARGKVIIPLSKLIAEKVEILN